VNFDDSEQERLLAASVRRFVERQYDFGTRRRIVASDEGWSREVWGALADLGLLGIALPAEFGGSAGGAVDQMSTMEAIGEALIVEPYLATVGLGAQFVARAGTEAQKQQILQAVIAGNMRMAFAQTETDARYDLAHVATRVRRVDGGLVIDGEKRAVVHGPCADMLVVSARLDGSVGDRGGLGVFLVDPQAAGVSMRSSRTLDGFRAADIAFEQVRIAEDARIGRGQEGLALIEDVVDYATALLCAEAIGALGYASHATLDYLKTRKQFGVPIGSFQALQHRMVDMVISCEQAKSMAGLACATVDTETDPVRRRRVVSAAKVRIADACRHVSQEAIQLHGGMGMSDEIKVSHTFRRLTMIAQQFGDADHHLERFAANQSPF
jgi:alkylation response protein AidB-like acyl-CoA dehydrogenase